MVIAGFWRRIQITDDDLIAGPRRRTQTANDEVLQVSPPRPWEELLVESEGSYETIYIPNDLFFDTEDGREVLKKLVHLSHNPSPARSLISFSGASTAGFFRKGLRGI